MSYCRFSSHGFRSDLYVYANVSGKWTIHVAANRHRQIPPPTYVYPEEHKVYSDSGGSFSLTPEGAAAWLKWQEESNPLDPIDLPFAGATFDLDTPGECADKMEELGRLGYHYPAEAIQRLRAEQIVFDKEDKSSYSSPNGNESGDTTP